MNSRIVVKVLRLMRHFNIAETPLSGLKRIQRWQVGDNRGFLSRLFCGEELSEAGWRKPIAQVNFTFTAMAGAVRGLHFQYPPSAEMKLVACVSGEVWDVAIDVRAGSPTFLQWYGVSLTAENGNMMLIPEGFAHGFQAMSSNVHMVYLHSAPYDERQEGGINPRDALLDIRWPRPIEQISDRDAMHPNLNHDFEGLKI